MKVAPALNIAVSFLAYLPSITFLKRVVLTGMKYQQPAAVSKDSREAGNLCGVKLDFAQACLLEELFFAKAN